MKITKAVNIKQNTYVLEKKLEILRNKAKLRNTIHKKVYFESDLTENEKEIQREIKKIADKEKEKYKRVKIKYQQLIIDNEKWTWNHNKGKLEKTDASTSKTTT